MRKLLCFLLLLTLTATHSFAQNNPLWLRYASISPDGKTICFTYKGDLFIVPSTGGTATPLTFHEAHDFMPVWSRDSKSIAFASDRYGNFDIYIIAAIGGEAKRLTYHSAAEYPYDFSPNNQEVLFGATRLDVADSRSFPTGSQPELYQVNINGGVVQQILSTPAEDVKWSKNGEFFVYHDKKGGENTWRKHHTSSITRDIWMFQKQTATHKKITSFNGEDRNPVLIENDKTIVYLSEASGTFNVFKQSLITNTKAEQITSFKKHPVRFLSSSNTGILCYTYDGEIYTQKMGENPNKVIVSIQVDQKNNTDKLVSISTGARDIAIAPNGKEIAFVARGEIFVTSIDGGITKRITNTPEQERSVSFSPDSKALLYASERGNSWKIFETKIVRKEEPFFYASTLLQELPIVTNAKENYQPTYSPDGKEIAFIEDRMTLKILNIATKQIRTILTDKELFSMSDNDQYYRWSPDGKWMLFDYAVPGIAPNEIGLIATDGKSKITNLTESGFNDASAKWVLGGKAMIWQSNKDGLKSVAQSGSTQKDVYALFFSKDAYDKFNLSKEDYALLKEIEEQKTKADSTKKKADKRDSIAIDWDGLDTRKIKLTIHSSNLADVLLSKDGETLYYLAKFEKGHNLWSTNIRTKETKMLVQLNSNGGSMQWDKEQKNIFVNSNGNIIKVDASSGKQETIRFSSEIMVDVVAERAFMFEHVWRRTKTTFYTQSMHGANWDALKTDYQKFLPHISNNYEFTEMLSELLGELNVSHSGASFNNTSSTGDATASLGIFIDYNFKGSGIKINEIIHNGPLDKAELDVKAGMIIEAIDGESITNEKDVAYYLNRKAGKTTLLTISNGTVKKDITVKPIALNEQNDLLYKRWVKKNQDEVEKLSNGQLGYVHIPGMSDGVFRNTYEDVMGKYVNKKGIVIDTRFNGGGDLVADLAMFLSGKKFMDYTTDTRSNGFEPNFRWTKPNISLVNEANYSDGHCYAFMIAELKLGKLVGMPVPGTCTFAAWESLIDNSIRWGVPPLGCKTVSGLYLENSQTNPDIQIMNNYEQIINGKDQQLETAVKELLKEIK